MNWEQIQGNWKQATGKANAGLTVDSGHFFNSCATLDQLAAIPGARLEWLPECGHMPTMEKPAAVNALLQAWLGSLEHISAPGGSG